MAKANKRAPSRKRGSKRGKAAAKRGRKIAARRARPKKAKSRVQHESGANKSAPRKRRSPVPAPVIPCIPIPSPRAINIKLFPEGVIEPKELPSIWSAQALLTPFGGQTNSRISPADQLVIANVTYDASDPANRFMRVGLYLFESLQYYDFFFKTSSTQTQWWWLISDPAAPDDAPAQAFGPFLTTAIVPSPDLLRINNLAHVGNWRVLGRPCDAFSGHRNATGGTWYWLNASGKLSRIMNYDPCNDFQIAIFGAYYLVDFPTFRQVASSNLSDVYRACPGTSGALQSPSPMLTLCDILMAMASPPSGTQMSCTLQQIRRLIPGIAQPKGTARPPSWTHRVHSECFMIGVLTTPYYCQLWYDWGRGTQITVFVWQDKTGAYVRMDDWLPRGRPGFMIFYAWDGAKWVPSCHVPPQPDSVAMPVPYFVRRARGICRATIRKSSYFGSISIWTAALPDDSGRWASDFWFWFNPRRQGVIFSLAPARSLTLTDYQDFVRGGEIDACIFADPREDIPVCSSQLMSVAKSKPRLLPIGHEPG
jgi:hypothetical protein